MLFLLTISFSRLLFIIFAFPIISSIISQIILKLTGFKPNILKCEVASIGFLKGVKMAVCGIKCIDVTTDTKKILGVHFSYDQKLQLQKKFVKSITNM